nr:O-acyltransferase WSD1-like [Ipomoea batatas]
MNGGFERDDEPLTPSSRLFFQPGTTQVINCLVACKNPVDIDAVKTAIRNSILMKHPRFCSVMVRYAGGRERWRRVHVNLDDHLIVHQQRLSDDRTVSDEDCVNDFLADLAVSSPLDSDKPLWEFHLLVAHNCAVLRLHHSLGDGVSLMSMFLSCCRRVDDPDLPPVIAGLGTSSDYRRRGKRSWSIIRFFKVLWYTTVYVLKFVLRILWVKDKRTALSGGAGVELWPRKLASATFILEDIKTVKSAVPDAVRFFLPVGYNSSPYCNLHKIFTTE